jgi:transposase
LLAELHARHVEVSYFAVWNLLDRAGLTSKKRSTPVNRTAAMLPGGVKYGSACRARLMLPG